MAIEFVGLSETLAEGTAISSLALDKPDGTLEGHLMLAYLRTSVTTVTPPAGWTPVAASTVGTSYYYLYAKVAGAGEAASFTWNFSGGPTANGWIATYSGQAAADYINISSNTVYNTNNTTLRAASMVTTVPCHIVFCGGTSTGRTYTPPTVPGTFTERLDQSGTYASSCLSDYFWSGTGATGNMDATLSSAKDTKHAFAVALVPAVASSFLPRMGLLGVG